MHRLNRKYIVIILGGIAGALFSIGGIYAWKNAKVQLGKNIQQNIVPPTSTLAAGEELWTDPAGFTFKYPKGISIDAHDEDTENYAHVELTSSNHSGKCIIWAKDTTAVDSDAWVKGEKDFSGAVSVDTTMGGQPAKKLIVQGPPKRFITATIADAIVFYIEAENGTGDFWKQTYDTIASSFTFISEENQRTSSSPAETGESDSTSVDEEEVVE